MEAVTLNLIVTRHAIERLVERGYWHYEGYSDLLERLRVALESGSAKTNGRVAVLRMGRCYHIFMLKGRTLTLKTVTSKPPAEAKASRRLNARISKAKIYTSPILNRVLGERRRAYTYKFRGG